VFEIFFSTQFVVLWAYSDGKNHCGVFAFLLQFAILGSQSWYFMIALDLFQALRNPFTDPKANLRLYHAYVWISSIASATIIVGAGEFEFRDGLEICWTKRSQGNANVYNWLLFFIPTLLYWAVAVSVLFYAWYRLNRGIKLTFQIRKRVLANGLRYTVAFTVYWGVAAAIYLQIWLYENAKSSNEEINADNRLGLYGTFAVLLGVRGLLDAVVWTYNERVVDAYRRWWTGGAEPDDNIKDINFALRKEVLLFCTEGIRTSVARAGEDMKNEIVTSANSAEFPHSLSPQECSAPALRQFELRMDNAEQKDAVPFLDFAPNVFRTIRSQLGISEKEYSDSIHGDTSAMIEKFTEGASGSFFYFSEDGQYLVKTLTTPEAGVLLQLLPSYVDYLTEHPHSLLTKFVGFHSVTLYNTSIYIVVMRSVFLTQKTIHMRFDLKGSWVNRHAGRKEGVLKDNDLNFQISLHSAERQAFLDTLQADADYLCSQGIMDYSLLLGIHNTRQRFVRTSVADEKQAPVFAEPQRNINLRPSVEDMEMRTVPFHTAYHGGIPAHIIEGPGIYFMGIIDILQKWTWSKKVERCFKLTLRCQESSGISAVSPTPYRQRFMRKMDEITEPPASMEPITDIVRPQSSEQAVPVPIPVTVAAPPSDSEPDVMQMQSPAMQPMMDGVQLQQVDVEQVSQVSQHDSSSSQMNLVSAHIDDNSDN
jgi:1-phosphatidylinositol-4-phosphate 5-kinase